MKATASAEGPPVDTFQQLISQQNQPSRNVSDEFNDLIQRIYQSDTRERALSHLAKRAEEYPFVGYTLWNTPAIIPIFLQEIVAGYPLLSDAPRPLKSVLSRVSNVLTILQRIARDDKAWRSLIKSGIVRYILPYLKIGRSDIENVRVNGFGLIGMLARQSSGECIRYLVYDLGIFPYCLDTLSLAQDSDKGAGKILASFIVEKVLQHDGLTFITEVPERCRRVIIALCNAIPRHPQSPAMKKLARNCISCFIRLCKAPIGVVLLKEMLPKEKLSETLLSDDEGLNKDVKELEFLIL